MNKRVWSFLPIIVICIIAMFGNRSFNRNAVSIKALEPFSDTVNIDELIDKWKSSDNWILTKNEKFNSINKNDESSKEWTETSIIERNGNILSRIHQAENGFKTLSVNVFDKTGFTHYYGRMDDSTPGWNWDCCEPNPIRCEGKIEEFFNNDFWLSVFLSTIKETETSAWEENGVYCFYGLQNVTEIIIRDSGRQLSFPKIWKHFRCTLTFGNSKVREPVIK